MNRSFLEFVTFVLEKGDKCIAGKSLRRGFEQDNICKRHFYGDKRKIKINIWDNKNENIFPYMYNSIGILRE